MGGIRDREEEEAVGAAQVRRFLGTGTPHGRRTARQEVTQKGAQEVTQSGTKRGTQPHPIACNGTFISNHIARMGIRACAMRVLVSLLMRLFMQVRRAPRVQHPAHWIEALDGLHSQAQGAAGQGQQLLSEYVSASSPRVVNSTLFHPRFTSKCAQ